MLPPHLDEAVIDARLLPIPYGERLMKPLFSAAMAVLADASTAVEALLIER